MSRLRVIYSIGNDSERFLVTFPRDKTIGDFLGLVKEQQKLPDLCAVYMDGALPDDDDPFDEWYVPGNLFRVTNSRTELPRPILIADLPDGPEPIRPSPVSELRVTYAIGNSEETFLMLFPGGKQIGDLLKIVKETQNKHDLCAVYLNGTLLDNNEIVDKWYSSLNVFQVTNSRTEAPDKL
jgi:hypothetical protein